MTRKKRAWWIAGVLAVLALAALAVLYVSLPRLVGRAIVAQAGRIGLKDLRLRVLHVGWQRLELADVVAGGAAAPALRVGRITVSYTPVGLWRKRIQGIRLAGVMLRIENRGQGFRFPGWAGVEEATEESSGALSIGRLDLEDGRLRLLLGDRDLDVPFSARLRFAGPGYSLEASIQPFGETIGLQGTLDKKFTSGTIAFNAPGMDLASLIKQSGYGASVSGRGRVAAAGELRLRNGNFLAAEARISSLGDMQLEVPAQGECEMSSFGLAFAVGSDFSVRDIVANAQGRRLLFGGMAVASPFGLAARGKRWPELEFVASGLEVVRPIPIVFERIAAKLVPPLETARLSGDFRMRAGTGLLAALAAGPWALKHPYAVSGNFQAGRSGGEVTWTLKAGGNGAVSLSAGEDSVHGNWKLDASLEGDTQRARASVSCRLAHADLRLANARARSGELGVSADLTFAFGGDWGARGTLQVRDGQFLAAGSDGLQASGVSVSLPWRYPGAGPGKSGSFAIARLQGGGLRAQNIDGTLGQEGQGFAFSGLAHTALPGIAVSFRGSYAPQASGGRMQADFLVPPAVLPAKTKLQGLHPGLQGMEGGGRFTARASIRESDGRIEGSASLKIVDGDLDHPGEGIVLRGLQAEVGLDSLLELRTPPAQILRFRELRWQGQAFRNGEIRLHGHGGDRLEIEAGRCEWNGGTVTIDPLTLNLGQADLQVTLRCAGVDLVAVLNALAGSAVVSGEARVSGVVPLKLVSGSPLFLDGLLETAPGVGGQLRVSKPEAISGGQVLVEEAIREFNYKWIKVRLDSKDNRLNMVVSIDGAPAGKLPLRYDQKKKDLVRDPSGKRHVELKGLLLDIRFNDIDLKDLLESGGKMTAGHK